MKKTSCASQGHFVGYDTHKHEISLGLLACMPKFRIANQICNGNIALKGLVEILVSKGKDQLAIIIKFNESLLSGWHAAYNFSGC